LGRVDRGQWLCALGLRPKSTGFSNRVRHPWKIWVAFILNLANFSVTVTDALGVMPDLWGDVVNTASRMESHGTAGCIQISDATRQALLQPFSLGHCGVIKVKGKCEMSTWFLNKSDQN